MTDTDGDDESESSLSIDRRSVFKIAGAAGVLGGGGSAALSAASQPALAASTIDIPNDIEAGPATISSYNIDFSGLDDVTNPLLVKYIFVKDDGTEVAAEPVSASEGEIDTSTNQFKFFGVGNSQLPSITGQIATGSHQIEIITGTNLGLKIELDHSGVSSPVKTDSGTTGTVDINTSNIGSITFDANGDATPLSSGGFASLTFADGGVDNTNVKSLGFSSP